MWSGTFLLPQEFRERERMVRLQRAGVMASAKEEARASKKAAKGGGGSWVAGSSGRAGRAASTDVVVDVAATDVPAPGMFEKPEPGMRCALPAHPPPTVPRRTPPRARRSASASAQYTNPAAASASTPGYTAPAERAVVGEANYAPQPAADDNPFRGNRHLSQRE